MLPSRYNQVNTRWGEVCRKAPRRAWALGAVEYRERRMPTGLDREVQRAVVRLRVNGEETEPEEEPIH